MTPSNGKIVARVLTVAAVLWGASPVILAVLDVFLKQSLPLVWAPESAAFPGLFLLERLLGYDVPTNETNYETVQIMARAAIFMIVNVSIWVGLGRGTLTLATWLQRKIKLHHEWSDRPDRKV